MNNPHPNPAPAGVTIAAGICPVCRARFRGAQSCSRCGADLGPLMTLEAHAARLRETARQAIREGDYQSAQEAIREAQRIHRTEAGDSLRFFLEIRMV